MSEKSKSLQRNIAPSFSEPARKKGYLEKRRRRKDMFRGLSVKPASTFHSNENQVSIDCIAQLNRYINDAQSGVCPLQVLTFYPFFQLDKYIIICIMCVFV